MRPYVLRGGEGWAYRDGVDFIVKAGEVGRGRRVAVLEYKTSEDELPGHTHRTEDEIFYVLKGSLTFHCGDETFDAEDGSFVFLPCGIRHGYSLRGGEAHLLVITSPAQPEASGGWGGFVADIETSGIEPVPPAGLS